MNISAIQNVAQQSLAGTIIFPKVVATLIAEGVESYHADLVRSENRYYATTGQTHVEKLSLDHPQAAQEFSAAQVESAIRESQAGGISYQEFLHKILAAGTVYYIVYLSGKKVIYFGREGNFHVEPFPQPK